MDQSPPINSVIGEEVERGFFPRLGTALFGAQAKRLREQTSSAHLLSYVLVVAQSIAVVLVFGQTEVAYLFQSSFAIRLMAIGALFLLIGTVTGADVALLKTMTRIPALRRNRQHGALFEHRLYQYFVLGVEGFTYGVVLYMLDSNPQALGQGRSLIPVTSWAFVWLVALRGVLLSWTIMQLIIVKGKLPVEMSTLMNTGKEIVGAHVEQQLKALHIAHIPVRATFGVYARMTQAPRPVAGILNALTGGWIVKRALAQEAEEARQAQNISAALAELDAFTPAAGATAPAQTMPALPTVSTASSVQKPLSPREQRRAQLARDMHGPQNGYRGHPTAPRGVGAALIEDMELSAALDTLDDDLDDDSGDGWQQEDSRMLRAGRLPEMDYHSGKRERAQAAHIAPREAALTVREFVMPDLPASAVEREDDSDHARAVFRVLEQDPRATRKQVMDRAGVSDGTARRYIAFWNERRSKRGKRRAAPRTQEMPIVTPGVTPDLQTAAH